MNLPAPGQPPSSFELPDELKQIIDMLYHVRAASPSEPSPELNALVTAWDATSERDRDQFLRLRELQYVN